MSKTFETKDSGKRVDFASGMRRDIDDGKPRYDLIPTFMLRRWAELLARGAKKYGENNWQLAESEEELKRFKASAFRHFVQWMDGEEDEDHGAAVFFNIAAAEMVKDKLDGRWEGKNPATIEIKDFGLPPSALAAHALGDE